MADRSRESALWGWLRDHLKDLKPLRYDVIRIENSVGVGTPDVNGCVAGGDFWCELKVARVLASGSIRVDITTSQVRRARARSRAGGSSWVLVRVCGPSAKANRHYLVGGMDAERLLEPMTEDLLGLLSHVPADAPPAIILKTMAGL